MLYQPRYFIQEHVNTVMLGAGGSALKTLPSSMLIQNMERDAEWARGKMLIIIFDLWAMLGSGIERWRLEWWRQSFTRECGSVILKFVVRMGCDWCVTD